MTGNTYAKTCTGRLLITRAVETAAYLRHRIERITAILRGCIQTLSLSLSPSPMFLNAAGKRPQTDSMRRVATGTHFLPLPRIEPSQPSCGSLASVDAAPPSMDSLRLRSAQIHSFRLWAACEAGGGCRRLSSAGTSNGCMRNTWETSCEGRYGLQSQRERRRGTAARTRGRRCCFTKVSLPGRGRTQWKSSNIRVEEESLPRGQSPAQQRYFRSIKSKTRWARA